MQKHSLGLRHYAFSSDAPIIFELSTHVPRPAPIFDMHLSPEIGVVLDGRMIRYSGNVRFELPRGGVWLSGMLEPHGRNAADDQCDVAVFIMSPDFFVKTALPEIAPSFWSEPLHTPPAKRPVLINERFARIVENLTRDLNSKPSPELKKLRLQIALLEILYFVNHLGAYKKSAHEPADDYWRLQPAFSQVYNSPRSISAQEAATMCELSLSKFRKLFSQVTGQTFGKFGLRYRLSRAAYAMRDKQRSLDEIADKWGFVDKSHLSNSFKKHYGMSPAKYRKNLTD